MQRLVILLLTSCATTPRPLPTVNTGACTLATVAAASACPRGQEPTEACVVASTRAVEACRPREVQP